MLHDLLLTLYYMVLGVALLFSCFYLWVLLEITLHELAHVLVGRLVGFRPYALTIGKGRPIFQRTMGGIAVTLHLIPFGGSTLTKRPRNAGLWWRGALFSLSGVMSDGLLLWGLLRVRDHFDVDQMNGGLLKFLCGLLMPFAFYQGAMIVTNLLPHNFKRNGRAIANDGLQFLGYITGQTQRTLQTLTEQYLQNVRRYDPEFTPETSWFIGTNHGSFTILVDIERDMANGVYESAAQRYLDLLSLPTMTKGERAMMLDSLASFALVRSALSFRERAIRWAKEAYELFPNAATLRGTLGTALVESGEYQRGIDVLTPLTTEGNTVHDMEISSCYLAKAYARLGDTEKAREWLERGRKSGAFLELSRRIEKEMDEVKAGVPEAA